MGEDSQNPPLVTFPKLLLAQNNLPVQICVSGTSAGTFALSHSLPLAPRWLVCRGRGETRVFWEEGRTLQFRSELIYCFFNNETPNTIIRRKS